MARKFDGVDFSEHNVIPLNPDQEDLARGFRCHRGEFVSYIRGNMVRNAVNSHITRCWLIRCDNSLAGYVTLLADKLEMKEPFLVDEDIEFQTFPAVKIGWLAADPRAKGAGTRLLDWSIEYVCLELCQRLGVRFLTVDALYDPDKSYDVSGFYFKNGFEYLNEEEELPPVSGYRSMYFDLKPSIERLKEIVSQS